MVWLPEIALPDSMGEGRAGGSRRGVASEVAEKKQLIYQSGQLPQSTANSA